jgi:lipid-binding SYLF domain-containing protein
VLNLSTFIEQQNRTLSMFTQSKGTPRTRFAFGLLISVATIALLAACSTAPRSSDDRSELLQDANSALSEARSGSSSFDSIIRNAPAYAVFPSVGKGGAGVGGAYGRGIVYKNGTAIGYADLSQATIGAQLGGQTYTQILVFETEHALDRFRQGNYEFGAQATAVALQSGRGTNAKFRDGIAVFTMAERGMMVEAAVGGQKFSYEAFASR